jgi:hypothetical protein
MSIRRPQGAVFPPRRSRRAAEPGDAVEALADARRADDGLLALAEHATEHLGDAPQGPFVVGARVLPPTTSGTFGNAAATCDGPAAVDPRVREHAGDADQVDVGRDAVDHLLGDEPLIPAVDRA